VLNHLADFARGGGAVLLATHDPEAASRAQRVIRLDAQTPAAAEVGVRA
jgi:ABC-type lipoprotein export system ATPase subunit